MVLREPCVCGEAERGFMLGLLSRQPGGAVQERRLKVLGRLLPCLSICAEAVCIIRIHVGGMHI